MKRKPLVSLILGAMLFCLGAIEAHADENWPATATEEDRAAAEAVFREWAEAFRQKRYKEQWLLTHPAIRHWINRKRHKRGMARAARRDGPILDYEISAVVATTADKIPCTEQGHCFRPGLKYIVFLIKSRYARAKPPQPEFIVMAWSDEGWRMSGGTFPNRPLGETSVIMTEEDEGRFKLDTDALRQKLRALQ
ncbi:hypothetical protein [Gimibacter soli]|uniref:DUF4019 domain-containing protein n=1 Tax=Gimibacter soli TaxID=3024400 RepID=A0AAE9XUG5_9PROT|nr:hypothetical protein [Gimibacter soli]WCL55251.1 hypothetical protein PH603_05710 [Gimibacter soli]